jgi:hypothetical protein
LTSCGDCRSLRAARTDGDAAVGAPVTAVSAVAGVACAADKARLGDVFYDGVAARADPLVDQWKRETAYEEKP